MRKDVPSCAFVSLLWINDGHNLFNRCDQSAAANRYKVIVDLSRLWSVFVRRVYYIQLYLLVNGSVVGTLDELNYGSRKPTRGSDMNSGLISAYISCFSKVGESVCTVNCSDL